MYKAIVVAVEGHGAIVGYNTWNDYRPWSDEGIQPLYYIAFRARQLFIPFTNGGAVCPSLRRGLECPGRKKR